MKPAHKAQALPKVPPKDYGRGPWMFGAASYRSATTPLLGSLLARATPVQGKAKGGAK